MAVIQILVVIERRKHVDEKSLEVGFERHSMSSATNDVTDATHAKNNHQLTPIHPAAVAWCDYSRFKFK